MRDKVDKVNHTGKPIKPDKAEKPSQPGDPDILDLVHAVMHLYRSRQYQTLRDGPHGVTHMDSKVLGFFARHPGATQSELAVHSGRDKAQLARLVAGLRERGLLEAAADAADRRSVHLSLTAEGQAVQRSLHQQARRQTTQAMAGFSAAERAQLQALLGRVKGNLEVGSPPDETPDRLAR